MCIKAIDIEYEEEPCFRILSYMLKGQERRMTKRVKFGEIAKALGVSEEVVRYNIRKLLRLGYIRVNGNGYEPTEKVLFLPSASEK